MVLVVALALVDPPQQQLLQLPQPPMVVEVVVAVVVVVEPLPAVAQHRHLAQLLTARSPTPHAPCWTSGPARPSRQAQT